MIILIIYSIDYDFQFFEREEKAGLFCKYIRV